MASRKKGTKDAVIRRISVPQGTREIVLHITIGRAKKRAFKVMKSGIDDDPRTGGGG